MLCSCWLAGHCWRTLACSVHCFRLSGFVIAPCKPHAVFVICSCSISNTSPRQKGILSLPTDRVGNRIHERGDSSEMRVLSGFEEPQKTRFLRSSQHICFCGNRCPSTNTPGTASENEFTRRGDTVHKSVSRGGGQNSFLSRTCKCLTFRTSF